MTESTVVVEAKVSEREELDGGTHVRLRLERNTGLDTADGTDIQEGLATALGLAGGQHIKVYVPNCAGIVAGEWNGKPDSEFESGVEKVTRRYTPVAFDRDGSWLDLVVELITPARAGGADGGKFSRFAAGLRVGDNLTVSGPHGVYQYAGSGLFARGDPSLPGPHEAVRPDQVGLICAGVAANTVVAILDSILRDPSDDCTPTVWAVISARTEEAVLHWAMLQHLMDVHAPERLRIWFSLEKQPAEGSTWSYGVGPLNEALTSERLPPPGEGTLLITTGADKVKLACAECLPKLGHESTRMWHWNAELDE
eukprot:gnl/TRDRNA2_/TRDRNA2_73694_c0_seq1.p1 gnl/TRDRNA2_/TRDRNA2_73694_c0~~gnl/TRDRNA2_/TRDRNA2_73694_c0_seq1.p1  ORF type:complete len:311 (-),score=50.18 gnl/TRDRNA2_/TRDRNA2_73694_c0_seq1:312-1244(-)